MTLDIIINIHKLVTTGLISHMRTFLYNVALIEIICVFVFVEIECTTTSHKEGKSNHGARENELQHSFTDKLMLFFIKESSPPSEK